MLIMKQIHQAQDKSEAEQIRYLLESRGIPAFISNTPRVSVRKALHHAPTVWVYLDFQAEDAAQLIADPEHEIDESVDVEEFYALMNSPEAKDTASRFLFSMMLKIFAVAAILVALIWILSANTG
jgi:hypothetical protein